MRLRTILLAAIFLAVPVTAQVPEPPSEGMPEQAHVTLAEDGGLMVQFAIVNVPLAPAETAQVVWSVDGGSETTTEAEIVGTVESQSAIDAGTTYVFAAHVPAEPGQTVTYEVGTDMRPMRGPFEVAVPPANGTLRFTAMGDIGLGGVAPDGSRDPAAENTWPIDIRDLALEQDPDLVIIPGDLAYQNSRTGWDRFMRMYEPLQATVPLMATIGNHEWHDDAPEFGYTRFLDHYVLPGNEQDFVFQAGPVTFVGVNSDAICKGDNYRTSYGHRAEPCPFGEPDTERITWLEGALRQADNDTTPWTVVFMHHPTYSWGRHGSDIGQQMLWGPMFEEYGADLIVAAHDHLYSRTYPTIDGKAQADGANFTQGQGPVYIASGGGGRSLYSLPDPEVEPRPEWHAVGESVHHITVVDASEGMLRVQAIRLDGSLLDEFTITRSDGAVGEGPGDGDEDAPAPPVLALVVALAALAWVARRR